MVNIIRSTIDFLDGKQGSMELKKWCKLYLEAYYR